MPFFTNFLLNTIFPKQCLSCHQEGQYVCPKCLDKIPTNKTNCFVCKKRSPDGSICIKCKKSNKLKLDRILVASDWNNLLVRQMIYEFKYRFIKDLSFPIAQIIIKYIQINNLITDDINRYIIIPVPLHKFRLSWRGYNQAQLIGQVVSDKFNINIENNLILRAINTGSQMEINDNEKRAQNVCNAFKINSEFTKSKFDVIKNKIIILVDDVCTTGSTLNECAKTLQLLKPFGIWGLVMAKG